MSAGVSRTAIVYGASGGIGPAVLRRLDRRGYRLLLVDPDAAAAQALATQVAHAEVWTADFTDRAALAALCERVVSYPDPIRVAVVNAGTVRTGSLLDSSTEDIDLQLELNLRAAVHLIRASAAHMRRAGGGHILATVSMGGLVALKGAATYAASKFGLRGLLASLAGELAPLGIRVSGIYPPGVDTAMLRYEAREGGSALNFVGTPVTPEDVADAFERALDRGALEVFVARGDGLSGRLLNAAPGLLRRLSPLLERIGERGRQRYLARVGAKPEATP